MIIQSFKMLKFEPTFAVPSFLEFKHSMLVRSIHPGDLLIFYAKLYLMTSTLLDLFHSYSMMHKEHDFEIPAQILVHVLSCTWVSLNSWDNLTSYNFMRWCFRSIDVLTNAENNQQSQRFLGTTLTCSEENYKSKPPTHCRVDFQTVAA